MTPPAALAADPASTRSTATRRTAPTREPLHAEAAPTHAQSAAPTPAAASPATPAPTHTPPARPAPSSSAPAPRRFDTSDPHLGTTTALSAPPLASSSDPAPSAPSALAEPITPMQRWAHELVLQIIQANIPPEALAIQFGIPFSTLITYLNLPEVQAEIGAYEELLTLRARLLGHTARPISLRKLLDVLQSPAPRPTRHDPEADQRALHRHAELIRRTATTISRESRALAPKPAPAPKPAQRTANVSERTSSSFPSPLNDDADSPNAEDALGCASPDAVDAPRHKPTGSTDPANTSSPAAVQPATTPAHPLPIAHSPLPSSPPSAPLPPSPSDPSFLSPPRDADSSAAPTQAGLRSAFSSRSRHARDRPAA